MTMDFRAVKSSACWPINPLRPKKKAGILEPAFFI